MTKYIVDTNFYMRFLLKDNAVQFKKTESVIKEAKDGKIQLVLYPEILLEICYVLQSVYKISREETSEYLLLICKTDYIEVIKRDLLTEAVGLFLNSKADLADCLTFVRAKSLSAKVASLRSLLFASRKVLSFDKDFKKLEKLAT